MQTKTLSLCVGQSVCLSDIGRITLSSVRGRATLFLQRVQDDTICLDEGDEVALKVLKKDAFGAELEIRIPDYYEVEVIGN